MTYVREQSSEELATHMRSLQRMAGWFEPLADRLWQEVEALQATIANQAKMIEHLRGGLTGYTAVDMTTAAAQGFRDGEESLRKHAEIGRLALQYFDRMDDPADCDPLEKSVSEFLAAVSAAMSKEG